jgi:nitrate reductase beta subunit
MRRTLYHVAPGRVPGPVRPGGDRGRAGRGHPRGAGWKGAQKQSPVWKLAMDWKLALPAAPGIPHPADGLVRAAAVADPERRPPPWQMSACSGDTAGCRARLRIPVRYLANLLTAGDEAPVITCAGAAAGDALPGDAVEEPWTAWIRSWACSQRVGHDAGAGGRDVPADLAIANYEDRFVIPSAHREMVEDAYDLKGGCGFTDGNGCSTGSSGKTLFGQKKFRAPTEFLS